MDDGLELVHAGLAAHALDEVFDGLEGLRGGLEFSFDLQNQNFTAMAWAGNFHAGDALDVEPFPVVGRGRVRGPSASNFANW